MDGRSGQARAALVARWGRVFSRPALLALGWLAVALGFVGIFVPGLPTVPFLLVAVWAFARSSQRLHDWLYHHPRLGPPLRDWREHGAISLRDKIVAVAAMAAGFGWIAFGVAGSWVLPVLTASCLVPAAAFIVTRPRRPPG